MEECLEQEGLGLELATHLAVSGFLFSTLTVKLKVKMCITKNVTNEPIEKEYVSSDTNDNKK